MNLARILATFALVMSTGVAMALPCSGGNCAADEPVVTNPQSAPEPQPFQTATPCSGSNCAIPEPVDTPIVCNTGNCAIPEPAPFQTAGPDNDGGGGRVMPQLAPFQAALPCPSSNCVIPEPEPCFEGL